MKSADPLLTDEQYEALMLAATQGLDHTSIGKAMNRTPDAAAGLLKRAYRKLGARNGAHAVTILRKRGVLEFATDEAPVRIPPRRADVLTLAARGWSNREIGPLLYLTQNTVGTQLKRCYDALGAKGRTHAIYLAHKHGILPRKLAGPHA